MSHKRKQQHRSPVPREEKEYTPLDVLNELHEVRTLVERARDKAVPSKKADKNAVSDAEVRGMLAKQFQGLQSCDVYQIAPTMMHEVRRAFNVHRSGIPNLEVGMMPGPSGYVFFDSLWTVSLPRMGPMRSLTWAKVNVPSSDLGTVPAVLVTVFAPRYSGMYSDLLPLGAQYEGEYYGHKRKGMQTLGRIVWTLWVYFNSELVSERRLRPWSRKDTPPRFRNIEHGAYRVIALRRRVDPDAEPGHRDVNWQVRWTVTGHWRHLSKYDGPPHKAVVEVVDGEQVCIVCADRGFEGKVTHIGAHTKPKDRTDLPWLKDKPTVYKLVR